MCLEIQWNAVFRKCGGATEEFQMDSSLLVALNQYVKEFPFIEEWITGGVKIKCKTINLDVLVSKPTPRFVNGACLVLPGKRFVFIDKDGEELCMVREDGRDCSQRSFWHPSTWFGREILAQSVEEAMVELGGAIANLKYVVCIHDCLYSSERVITIYKLPAQFSLQDFVRNEKKLIRDRVKEEVGKWPV
jgi:hypothetical protein